MDDNDFLAPFERLLDEIVPSPPVRDADAADAGWATLEASGFLDALVGEDRGGAGLSLLQVAPLLEAAGARLAPMPIGQTMAARALLAQADSDIPAGPIALAAGDGSRARGVDIAAAAQHFLVDTGGAMLLFDRRHVAIDPVAGIGWSEGDALARLIRPEGGLRPTIATLAAVDSAGAAAELFERTLTYARDRQQFGRSIGSFQAVQQQLAVMAEKVVMMRMAARIGCAGTLPIDPDRAAIAKGVASAAVVEVAAIAHAVHGAIGVSEEHDLWLFTRRLNDGRARNGSESFWFDRLGRIRLDRPDETSTDFVRSLYLMETDRI